MPTLTEDIALPGGVAQSSVVTTVKLWGVGAAVTGYEQGTAKTIAGVATVTGNPWTLASVVGNTDIDIPTGTTYQVTRSWPNQVDGPLVDYVTMPATGGPYRVDQILALTPATIPSSAASSEVGFFSLASNSSALTVNAITLVAVPTFIIDIPDLSRPVLFHGNLTLQSSVSTGLCSAGVGPVGISSIGAALGIGFQMAGPSGAAGGPLHGVVGGTP